MISKASSGQPRRRLKVVCMADMKDCEQCGYSVLPGERCTCNGRGMPKSEFRYRIGAVHAAEHISLFADNCKNMKQFRRWCDSMCCALRYLAANGAIAKCSLLDMATEIANAHTNKSKQVQPKLRYEVMKRDGFRCQLCGAEASDGATLEVDHKMPKSKGGASTASNLWTLCKECNNGKSDDVLPEFGDDEVRKALSWMDSGIF